MKYDSEEFRKWYEENTNDDALYKPRLAFLIKYGDEIMEKHGVYPEFLFDEYMYKVEPNLLLLTDFKINNREILEKEIRMGLGITANLFSLMKKYFPELKDALSADKSLMSFKSQLALMKANELKPENAKTVELMMLRYDPEFKKKDEESKPEHKLTVEFKDGLTPFDEKEEENE